jgi:hypothetical protein
MATLYTHAHEPIDGDADTLEDVMVLALMTVTQHRPANLRRYCEASVRAAIRRDGATDANQRLVMTPAERQAWELANPLSE